MANLYETLTGALARAEIAKVMLDKALRDAEGIIGDGCKINVERGFIAIEKLIPGGPNSIMNVNIYDHRKGIVAILADPDGKSQPYAVEKEMIRLEELFAQ